MAIKFLNTVQVDTDVLYVDASSDKVGIGTTNPSTKLEISSSGVNGIDISQSASNASQSGRLFFTTNTTSEGFLFYNNNGTLQINSGGIPNDTSGNNRISVIGSSGNVGIGTTSPDYKLEVNGTLGVSRTDGIIFAGSAGTGTGNKITSDTSNDLIFSTALGGAPYTSSERMRIDNGGNVGIGTPFAATKLHVSGGDIRIDDTERIEFGAGGVRINNDAAGRMYQRAPLGFYWETTGGYRMVLNSSGNVGIGTTSPSTKLDVYGGLRLGTTGDFFISQSPFITTQFYISGGGTGGTITFGAPAATQQNVSVQGDLSTFAGSTSGYLGTKIFGTFNNRLNPSGDNYLNSGDLGIGTTNPNAKLDVVQSTAATSEPALHLIGPNTNTAMTTSVLVIEQGSGDKMLIDGNDIDTAAGMLYLNDYSTNDVVFGGQIRVGGGGSPVGNSWFANGNVGIGTTTPSTKLHVLGTTASVPSLGAAASAAQIGGSTYGTLFSTLTSGTGVIQQGRSDGNTLTFPLLINPNGGNVGIGTTSPGAKLDVAGGDIRLATNATYLRVRDTAGAQPRFLGMSGTNTTYIGPIDSYAGGGVFYGVSANVAYHAFYGGGSEKVRITSAGNVGIGTTQPRSKLEVNGGIKLANDADPATASKAGTFRYYTSGNNSYVDMCMQTGASTYAWVNVVTNSW